MCAQVHFHETIDIKPQMMALMAKMQCNIFHYSFATWYHPQKGCLISRRFILNIRHVTQNRARVWGSMYMIMHLLKVYLLKVYSILKLQTYWSLKSRMTAASGRPWKKVISVLVLHQSCSGIATALALVLFQPKNNIFNVETRKNLLVALWITYTENWVALTKSTWPWFTNIKWAS